MGLALITDCGAATMAAAAVQKNLAAGAGSTFTVRNAALTSKISLTDVWRKGTAAGNIKITSPNIVPVTNGIYIDTEAGLSPGLLGGPPLQALTPQDNLTISGLDGNSDIMVGAIQSYYQDLPGASMILKNPGDIAGSAEFVFGWPVAAVAAANEGDQASTVITTTVDSSSANAWYALLGYICATPVAAVGIAGVDTSQLFVGGPGNTDSYETRNYFADLSLRTGMPCVPMFNAANKASTNVVAVDNAASTAVNVTLILAQMPASYNP